MGYTSTNPVLLIGLGVSAISDIGIAYAQNEKALSEYYNLIEKGILPVTRGYLLSPEDVFIKKYILDISCRGETIFDLGHIELLRKYSFPKLEGMSKDGLVTFDDKGLTVTPTGHNFIRNICSAFDMKMMQAVLPETNIFSSSI